MRKPCSPPGVVNTDTDSLQGGQSGPASHRRRPVLELNPGRSRRLEHQQRPSAGHGQPLGRVAGEGVQRRLQPGRRAAHQQPAADAGRQGEVQAGAAAEPGGAAQPADVAADGGGRRRQLQRAVHAACGEAAVRADTATAEAGTAEGTGDS